MTAGLLYLCLITSKCLPVESRRRLYTFTGDIKIKEVCGVPFAILFLFVPLPQPLQVHLPKVDHINVRLVHCLHGPLARVHTKGRGTVYASHCYPEQEIISHSLQLEAHIIREDCVYEAYTT